MGSNVSLKCKELKSWSLIWSLCTYNLFGASWRKDTHEVEHICQFWYAGVSITKFLKHCPKLSIIHLAWRREFWKIITLQYNWQELHKEFFKWEFYLIILHLELMSLCMNMGVDTEHCNYMLNLWSCRNPYAFKSACGSNISFICIQVIYFLIDRITLIWFYFDFIDLFVHYGST